MVKSIHETHKKDSDKLFNAIDNNKTSFFYKSEVDRYVKLGAVTCTNVAGNKYHIKSNTDDRSIDIILK